jgi:hypothetical protein
MFPKTKFLAFTKQYNLFTGLQVPHNLKVVFSAWPGLDVHNPDSRPIAWMQDGTEDRIPETALHCPGSCENCMMCWSLDEINRDVWFTKH